MTRSYLHDRLLSHPSYQGLDAAQHVGLTRLKSELSLTPAQERIVTKVLDDYAKYYQNIQDEREDVAEHGKQRILDALSPEQQRKFLRIFSGSAR